MRSERRSDGFDLERDLPTTAEDVEALRRIRPRAVTMEEYLRFLAALGDADPGSLRRRSGPTGEPFRLD